MNLAALVFSAFVLICLSHTCEIDTTGRLCDLLFVVMITQKDIARQLGVSPSLVSRVLTGTASDIGASTDTVCRIREEAARLNYRPSAAALTLRGIPTRTIGVIVKNFEDPFFGHMIGELQGLAATKQYSLVLTGCPSRKTPQIDSDSLLKYQLDGVIVAGSDFEPEGLDAFSAKGIPVVQIGAGQRREGVVKITVDQQFGLKQLVAYLEKLGHRDIGYIGDDTPPHLRREAIVRTILKRPRPGYPSECLGARTSTRRGHGI